MDITGVLFLAAIPVFATVMILLEDRRVQAERKQK